ncbi:MAG: IS1634 family transposase [Psychromonas sp.]
MNYPYTKSLEHHGLVAGFCKEINLANIIDQAIGTSEHRQVSFGNLFVAMIINGLGFTGRTLHMYSEYFSDKPLDRLIGPGIKPEHINDDALGRCLEALYKYGVSSLYQDIGEAVVKHLDLPCNSVHLDSTSFHYDGVEKLSGDGDDIHPIHITKGYSRDHRPELNQVVLNLICENQSGIPVYMKPASGNVNDLEGFKEIVKSHISSLKAAQSCRYLVADAALYVKETIIKLNELKQLFITRVPQKLSEAKALINQAQKLDFEDIGNGYSGVWHQSNYGDIEQKWLLIRSEQARKRETYSLTKRMLKKGEAERKTFKKLTQQRFACQHDAQQAIELWRVKQVYSDVVDNIKEIPIYGRKGQPKKGQAPERLEYQITGALFTPIERRINALNQLGFFIIATNDLDSSMTMGKMLSTYKEQQSVEKGFRFLKSPDFLTNSIFIKKPERIEALLMVMTSCLMVYASLEHQIRKKLKEKDLYFPDQKKKPYQNPTARWVFQCFQGVAVIYLEDQTPMVVNWKERQQVIIDCLGDNYRRMYS